MENKLKQVRDDVLKQLDSYKKFPAKSMFDRGYRAGMLHTLGVIILLDRKLRNENTIKYLENSNWKEDIENQNNKEEKKNGN